MPVKVVRAATEVNIAWIVSQEQTPLATRAAVIERAR
jgi:hypothetical protein